MCMLVSDTPNELMRHWAFCYEDMEECQFCPFLSVL
jgi:hypothetical protein